jgi:hypothetical protein
MQLADSGAFPSSFDKFELIAYTAGAYFPLFTVKYEYDDL